MNDLRFALRQLLKSPGYTFIAVATLALGIGLNTSMFSLMNLLILRPLPYPEKDQLVRVYRTTAQNPRTDHTAASFLDLQRETAGYIKLAGYRPWAYTLTQPGRSPENLNALRVSGDFFSIIGLQPLHGRLFAPDEDQPGNRVIILSYAAWMANFGGDPAIVGQAVSIDGEPTTIVGVMPEKFSSLFLWGPGDAFRPLALTDVEKAAIDESGVQVLGRFDSSLSLEQLNSRLATVFANLADSRPRSQSADGIRAVTLQSSTMAPGTDLATVMLLCLSGFVLLIVCGNLANLQLARAVSRGREFAVRAALGASRGHLLRPLLFESLLLALVGGLLGILVTVWGNEWISKQISANLPIHFDLILDWRVLTFALGLSAVTGVFFGLTPAWLSSSVKVSEALKAGGRSSTGDRSQHRLRNALIVLQFASALILLSSAGFFVRGMKMLLARDPGWTTAGLSHGILSPPQARYTTPEQTYALYTRLEERLRALPGVENVAIGWTAPIYQFLTTRTYVVEGREPPAPGQEPVAFLNGVTPAYLDTLKIRLLSGRHFTDTDKLGAPPVVMINEAMAKVLFPDQNPVGQRLATGEGAARVSAEIVGVFSDVGMAGNPGPVSTPFQVFQPLAQEVWNYVGVLVRSERGPMTEALRQAVRELDPNIPIQMLNTADELAKTGTRAMELITTIFLSFSVLGLFLAALGLYGVIMRLVMQRTSEIGVRLALGASWRDIITLIMGAGFRLALIGAGIGLLGSMAMSVVMSAMFAGEASLDLVVLPLTTLLLVLVALVACYLPARRATKVDPMVALRAE